MKNILTVDVEEWYCDLPPESWEKYESRVGFSTKKILSILKETNNTATFFILGYVARKHPELVLEIKKHGHEIASHGYWHRRITNQTPEEFEKDLDMALRILKKITGEEVLGYRAPQFTIDESTSYAIGILKKYGLKYDSSIFPAKTPLYGVPTAPLYMYNISEQNITQHNHKENFIEIPISIYEFPFIKMRIPLIGGIYFRLFPYFLTKQAIKKINKQNKPAIFYMHPWEFDPEKPRIADLQWYHYYGIGSSEKKLRKLLKEHKFISIREWIEKHGDTRSQSNAVFYR